MMADKKKVVAISGSTRAHSTNLNYIKAIQKLAEDHFSVQIFEDLLLIPPFNPDDDQESPPEVVSHYRNQLKNSDGILICTPEYAMGVPGVLKNAIDWTVSSMEFSNKPVALITASSMGQKGHAALLETLQVIEARFVPATALLIPFAKTKISNESVVTDASTLEDIRKLIMSFSGLMNSA